MIKYLLPHPSWLNYMDIPVCLPQKPERPLDSDCCGQGCDPCVLDLYEEEVKIWEEECRRISAGEEKGRSNRDETEQVSGPVLSPTEYRRFVVDSVRQETEDSFRYRLKLEHGACLGLKTGQHIIIRGEVNGSIIIREYTPVSDVGMKSYFELMIKIYKNGCMSQYVKTWSPWTEVQIRGPCGQFEYKPNKYRKIYMLAVGTGIAPMSQVIQTVLKNNDDDTMITLLYGCRTYTDILLKSELDDWARYWNFSCTFCLSQEEESSTKVKYRYGDKILTGRISYDLVHSVIDNTNDSFLVLICGTRSFEGDMIQYMKDLGIDKSRYHKF